MSITLLLIWHKTKTSSPNERTKKRRKNNPEGKSFVLDQGLHTRAASWIGNKCKHKKPLNVGSSRGAATSHVRTYVRTCVRCKLVLRFLSFPALVCSSIM